MDIDSPKKIANLLVMKDHLLFVYKRYELVEEVVPIGNNLLLLYKHDHLSDETDPKKSQNVRLFDNEGHILWTVQNPSSIIFLGIRYKDKRLQLIASDGKLYDINLETGDIGLGPVKLSQPYPDTSRQWYNMPQIEGGGVIVNHPPEKMVSIDKYYYFEFYRHDDLVEKIIDAMAEAEQRRKLLIYKLGKWHMKTESEENQYIQLGDINGNILWTMENLSDDVFVDAKYEDGYTQLIASNGNLYDLNLETGDMEYAGVQHSNDIES